MNNRDIEIGEAINAGERGLRSLEEARRSLGSARNWGLLDLFGGTIVSVVGTCLLIWLGRKF